MVKTRLRHWGLQKHLHLPELRTALKLLGPDRSRWPSQAPQFLIHGRLVALDDILRSCGRKGIQDPFEWACLTSDNDDEHSSNVELLTETSLATRETEVDHTGQPNVHFAVTIPQSSNPYSLATLPPQSRGEIVFHPYPGVSDTFDWPLPDPDIFIHRAMAVQRMQSYCLEYMASASSLNHHEPDVHHLTCHARFLDQMDEGISLIHRKETDMAFEKFGNGFKLLKKMFMDIHPMSIATYMLLMCKLIVNNLISLSTNLLEYAHGLSKVLKSFPRCLVELLHAISQSKELELPLLCLRAASDILETTCTMDWKTLYVKERHCDALYQTGEHGELAIRRGQLLQLQEVRYGTSARNVLWTSLNVADDHLYHDQLYEAEARFTKVLQQADQHSGYHRAKTRVVALEGLAKVAFARASKQLIAHLDSATALQNLYSASQLLQLALQYANEALEMAQIWFENATRRIKRLLDLRDAIHLRISSMWI
jgi:hypothetical protein